VTELQEKLEKRRRLSEGLPAEEARGSIRRAASAGLLQGETVDETEERQRREAEEMRKRMADPQLAQQAAAAPAAAMPATVYNRPPTPPRASRKERYALDKALFEVVFGPAEWELRTPPERLALWKERIRDEQEARKDALIIPDNDPILLVNLPDPLCGKPTRQRYDDLFGRGAWDKATPWQRYTRWAERVTDERAGKARVFLTKDEILQATLQKSRDEQLAKAAAEKVKKDREALLEIVEKRKVYPEMTEELYKRAFGDESWEHDTAVGAAFMKGRWMSRCNREWEGREKEIILTQRRPTAWKVDPQVADEEDEEFQEVLRKAKQLSIEAIMGDPADRDPTAASSGTESHGTGFEQWRGGQFPRAFGIWFCAKEGSLV
jgi:hypothetical protein